MTTTKIISAKSPTWVRALQIGIGAIAVGLSLSAIIFPVIAVAATFTVAGIILLLFGIEQIVAGLRGGKSKEKNGMNTTASRGSRAFSIGAGALAVALSIAIMVTPVFGIALAGIVIGIAVLVYGVRLVVTGISGRKDEEAVRSTLSS